MYLQYNAPFQKLALEDFMLYAHGSDLCHDLELRHAMANCFEAFMGALFLDGGIHVSNTVLDIVIVPITVFQVIFLHMNLTVKQFEFSLNHF